MKLLYMKEEGRRPKYTRPFRIPEHTCMVCCCFHSFLYSSEPSMMHVAYVASVHSRYVVLAWTRPISPNGILTHYTIYVNRDREIQVSPLQS